MRLTWVTFAFLLIGFGFTVSYLELYSLLFDLVLNNAVFNKALFYKISDPLTAPRITRIKDEPILLKLHLEMREMDLGVYKTIAKMVRLGYTDKIIESHLEELKKEFLPVWDDIENQFNQLIGKYEYTSRR